VPLPAADGSASVTVKATDAAGNDSPVSAPVTVVVDRTGPASAPTISPALPALTNVASVTVAGVTEPNATVTVLVDGVLAVTTSADGAGSYSVSAPLPSPDATYSVQVRANDLAGNPSPVSVASTVQLDRTAPAAPVLTAPSEGASVAPGTIAVTGTAEPGSTVTVVVDGTPHVVTADVGTGTFQVDVPLTDGNHFVTATVTDPAGNTSAAANLTFVVATPPAPSGGCGCGAGGASAPETLLLVVVGLMTVRRRRLNPANLSTR
jgi:MYXO-CTERM domain-containing protein